MVLPPAISKDKVRYLTKTKKYKQNTKTVTSILDCPLLLHVTSPPLYELHKDKINKTPVMGGVMSIFPKATD